MAALTCESCGGPFEAKRSNARFCGERCKKRAQRGHLLHLRTEPEPRAADSAGASGSSLVSAVEAELRGAKRLDTPLGQAALTLAARIVRGADTGSAIASMVREMRMTLADAVSGASRPASPLDGLRDELDARRRA